MRQFSNLPEVRAVLISVCICTYRRAHVRDTIASVLAQDCLDRFPVEILVCDDDPNCSAKPLVQVVAKQASIAVRYVVSGARNIAAARNTCLAEARGTWIAFVDDDELAEPSWLSNLIAAQRAHDAHVVKGYVRGVYPPGTPAWILAGDPYTRDYGVTGRRLTIAASGNVIFQHDFVSSNNVKFNLEFGRSGGEDTDFFRQLGTLGARMVACREAIVNEIVPPDRITVDYIRNRYLRLGQVDGYKIAAGRAEDSSLKGMTKSVLFVAVCWVHPVIKIFSDRLHFRLFSKYWYSRGVLQGLRGHIARQTLVDPPSVV